MRRGGVVGGTSAGLAVMADVMIEGGASVDGAPARAELARGLGVLKHVLAEQHFTGWWVLASSVAGGDPSAMMRDEVRFLRQLPG